MSHGRVTRRNADEEVQEERRCRDTEHYEEAQYGHHDGHLWEDAYRGDSIGMDEHYCSEDEVGRQEYDEFIEEQLAGMRMTEVSISACSKLLRSPFTCR